MQSGFHSLENILQGFVCPCLLICRWRPLLFRSMGILLSFLMKMCRSLSLGQEKYVITINQAHVLFLRSRLLSFLGFFLSVPPLKKKGEKKWHSAFRNLGMLFTSLYWQNRASYFTYQKLLMTQVMNRTNDLPLIFLLFFFEGGGGDGEWRGKAWPNPRSGLVTYFHPPLPFKRASTIKKMVTHFYKCTKFFCVLVTHPATHTSSITLCHS